MCIRDSPPPAGGVATLHVGDIARAERDSADTRRVEHPTKRDLDRLHGLFARLAQPIDIAAIDDQPVDLIFLLLAPESAGADHLKALARVSRLLRDKTICEKLRGCDSAEAIYALLTDSATSHAA